MCCGDILLIQCIAMGGDLYSDGHWTVIVPGISGRLWRWLEMIRKKDARALGRWLFPSLCSDHFSRKTVVISQCVRGSICTMRTIISLLVNWPKKGRSILSFVSCVRSSSGTHVPLSVAVIFSPIFFQPNAVNIIDSSWSNTRNAPNSPKSSISCNKQTN